MKFSQVAVLVAGASLCAVHPERLTRELAEHELISRGSDKCAAQIEARIEAVMAKRAASLHRRQIADGKLPKRQAGISSKREELQYTSIQNDTCALAPETVWGPYAIDNDIYRHDVREGQQGIDFYFDIGLIDVETCEPYVSCHERKRTGLMDNETPDAYLTIWSCNATGTYSGYTGISPDTVELIDGYTKNADGTTDEETFLRGIMKTDTEGMAEFLTVFPGYYSSRTTHIHLTVQTNVTNSSSYNTASTQHLGQLFFNETLLNEIYALAPYSTHLATLNRTTNAEGSLYASANGNGYSAVVSVSKLGAALADGLVGYITIGVNTSTTAAVTTGGSVNPIGVIPTLSIDDSIRASATLVDQAAGYTAGAGASVERDTC